MKDAVWFLLWWTVGFTYPSLSASIIWGLGQQDSYTVDQLHWLFCVTNICVDLGNYILITVYDAFWCKFQNSKVVHGCVVQPYWVFVSCHWGWWSWPWQALWEILLQAPAHDVAQRSIRAWKDWVYTETMTAFCETVNYLKYWYITFFFITLKVYYSYDIARQEWEALLPSADLWYRDIHAHCLHPNCWPGLSALWFGFQETTVSWRDVFVNVSFVLTPSLCGWPKTSKTQSLIKKWTSQQLHVCTFDDELGSGE